MGDLDAVLPDEGSTTSTEVVQAANPPAPAATPSDNDNIDAVEEFDADAATVLPSEAPMHVPGPSTLTAEPELKYDTAIANGGADAGALADLETVAAASTGASSVQKGEVEGGQPVEGSSSLPSPATAALSNNTAALADGDSNGHHPNGADNGFVGGDIKEGSNDDRNVEGAGGEEEEDDDDDDDDDEGGPPPLLAKDQVQIGESTFEEGEYIDDDDVDDFDEDEPPALAERQTDGKAALSAADGEGDYYDDDIDVGLGDGGHNDYGDEYDDDDDDDDDDAPPALVHRASMDLDVEHVWATQVVAGAIVVRTLYGFSIWTAIESLITGTDGKI